MKNLIDKIKAELPALEVHESVKTYGYYYDGKIQHGKYYDCIMIRADYMPGQLRDINRMLPVLHKMLNKSGYTYIENCIYPYFSACIVKTADHIEGLKLCAESEKFLSAFWQALHEGKTQETACEIGKAAVKAA